LLLDEVTDLTNVNTDRAVEWSAFVDTQLPIAAVTLASVPAMASFIGLVVDRTPQNLSIIAPRSHCCSCKRTLFARDLIPIISYVTLRGRCRFCSTQIPPTHLLSEISALILAGISIAFLGISPFLGSAPLAVLLFTLACFDLRHGLLPNWLTLPLALTGLVIAPLASGAWASHALGGIAGVALTTALALTYRKFRGVDGLGGGDTKLFGAVGIWVGWNDLFVVMLGASIAAIAFILVFRNGTSTTDRLLFGPFIAAATWIVWCWQVSASGWLA
jgi:leader peptidase (prepilin peptidase)/N-methyltransferase